MRVGESFCPGILHTVPAKDGLLMRIRIPGGIIRSDQLKILAESAAAFAGGQMEITARANVQLRGIREQDRAHVVDLLTNANLLPSAEHDRVRNILSSPLAGLDPAELIDVRPFIDELDRRLCSDLNFVQLHPKFSFGLDGGGPSFSPETDDLSLHAVRADGATKLLVAIGGTAIGFCIGKNRAVECLLIAAQACIGIATAAGIPARSSKVLALPGALQQIVRALANLLVPSIYQGRITATAQAAPLGVYAARLPNHVNVIPSVPLGRLSAAQASLLAGLAAAYGADIRLAPWRGVVIGTLPTNAVEQVIARLQAIGLPCDDRDGFRGIAACSGSNGCDASLADVRADAVFLASELAGYPVKPDWTIHFSGCEKRCAMRHEATAELIATPSGYNLRLRGQAETSLHTSASAIAAILLDARQQMFVEAVR